MLMKEQVDSKRHCVGHSARTKMILQVALVNVSVPETAAGTPALD